MDKDHSTASSRIATSGWEPRKVDEVPNAAEDFSRKYVAKDPPDRRTFQRYYVEDIDLGLGETEHLGMNNSRDGMAVMILPDYEGPQMGLSVYVNGSAAEHIGHLAYNQEVNEEEAFASFIDKTLDGENDQIWTLDRQR